MGSGRTLRVGGDRFAAEPQFLRDEFVEVGQPGCPRVLDAVVVEYELEAALDQLFGGPDGCRWVRGYARFDAGEVLQCPTTRGSCATAGPTASRRVGPVRSVCMGADPPVPAPGRWRVARGALSSPASLANVYGYHYTGLREREQPGSLLGRCLPLKAPMKNSPERCVQSGSRWVVPRRQWRMRLASRSIRFGGSSTARAIQRGPQCEGLRPRLGSRSKSSVVL